MRIETKIPWHQTAAGCWSASFASAGYRIRVMQRVPDGPYYRIVVIGHKEQGWRSLRTKDRRVAEREVRRLLTSLVQQANAPADPSPTTAQAIGPLMASTLTLGRLWFEYKRGSQYGRNVAHTRAGKDATARILLAGLGEDTLVLHLDAEGIGVYTLRRYDGGISYRIEIGGRLETRVTPPVGKRAVQSDLQLLRAMLRWATTVKVDGQYLLAEFPVRGLTLPAEATPSRPVVTYERMVAVMAACRDLAKRNEKPHDDVRFAQLELFLILIEAFGRRPANVRRLRWRDIVLVDEGSPMRSYIRWVKEHDKTGAAVTTAIPEQYVRRIRQLRATLAGVGSGWVFRQLTKEKPQSTSELGRWHRRAEAEAELEHVDGAGFYPGRRKWATERKQLPLKDVMEAGGWRDPNTLLKYQQADQETIDAVIDSPTKLTSRGLRHVDEVAGSVRVRGRPGASIPSSERAPGVRQLSIERREAPGLETG